MNSPSCKRGALEVLFGIILSLLLVWTSSADAQFGGNGQTNTVSGVGSQWNGDYYIGGSFDVLRVINGGGLTNRGAYIGYNSGADNNLALVSGNGSLWSNSYTMFLGYFGINNRLIINDGGQVISSGGWVGQNGGGNSILVSDNNSLWDSSSLTLGNYSSNNLMIITNGARVLSTYSAIGAQSVANGNLVLVSGSNSLWSMSGSLQVGSGGSLNQLIINNGAQVVTDGANQGSQSYVGVSGTNNLVLVSGSGSLWTNTGGLTVGYAGAGCYGSQLIVTNGGRVVNGTTYIDWGSGGGHVVLVSGSNSILNNTSTLYVGIGGSSNQLIVNDGGQVMSSNSYVGWTIASGAVGNTAFISDSNSFWNAGKLYVGFAASSNQLIISRGGRTLSTNAAIGSALQLRTSFFNVSVTTNAGAGGTNTITTTKADILYAPNNNLALIAGIGSSWTNNNTLTIGAAGMGNSVVVSNGGVVMSGPGVIGSGVICSNSYQWSVVVTKTNGVTVSTVTNRPNVVVASTVSNMNNSVLVSDAGSVWNSSGRVTIGSTSVANSLTVTNGGLIVSVGGTIGDGLSANNNVVTVAGGSSGWTNMGSLYVGNNGSSNQLNISSGGSVIVFNDVVIGANPTAVGNVVQVMAGGVLTASNLVLNSGSYISRGGTNTFSGDVTIAAGASFSVDSASACSVFGNYRNLGSSAFSNVFTVANGSTFQSTAATNRFSSGLLISSGGGFNAGSGLSVVEGVITNAGTVSIANATVVFNGNVVNQGAWVTDPMTNIFNGNFTVGPTAYVSAASGDVYAFGADFVMQSTNFAFNMSGAVAYFGNTNYGITTGVTNHTFDVGGSGAKDMGAGYSSFSQVASNFAIGTLSIGISNRLTITGSTSTNALYVRLLDMPWADTNSFSGVTNSLVQALYLPNINVYYDYYSLENAWLNKFIPGAGYDLWGGGKLLPIPEPSAFALILVAVGCGAQVARRRNG